MIKSSIIGITTGIFNGLFGSGGGTIAVPSMKKILKTEEHKAHATAILIILPLTITSLIAYAKHNHIDWELGWRVSIGGMVGGYLGAYFLKKIPSNILKKIFGFFMILAAVRMVF